MPDVSLFKVIEALASELEAAAAGHGEKADIVTLETVREILEAALEEEMRIAEGDEVRGSQAF